MVGILEQPDCHLHQSSLIAASSDMMETSSFLLGRVCLDCVCAAFQRLAGVCSRVPPKVVYIEVTRLLRALRAAFRAHIEVFVLCCSAVDSGQLELT